MFIANEAVEVLDTIVFDNAIEHDVSIRRMRDMMTVVATQGLVEWLNQNDRPFVLNRPSLQITRPDGVVCQTDSPNSAFYTLMYMEEWCNTRPVLELPRAYENDLMKWYLNRWLQFGTTNRMKSIISR